MFLKLVHKCYKDCAVPQCKSNTYETPYKLFFALPKSYVLRKQWLALARALGQEGIPSGSRIFFCSDHFDLPNDMINYMDYYKSGSVSRLSLIRGCVPSKFDCQNDKSSSSDTPQDTTDNKQCNVTLPKLDSPSLLVSDEHSLTNDFINQESDPLFVKEEIEDVKEDTMLSGISSKGDDDNTSDTVKIEKPNDESVETKEGIQSDTVVESINECTIKNNKLNINIDMVMRSCDICYEMVFSKDYTAHLRTEHEVKRYSCRKCNKFFKSSYHLKWHNRVHDAHKQHKCELCSKRFSKAFNLETHKFMHEDELYACNLCGKPFFLLSQLRSHVRVAHEGNRRSKASLSVTDIKQGQLITRGETGDKKEKTKLNDSLNNDANTFTVTVKNTITNELPTELEEGKLVKDNLTVDIEMCDIKTEIEMNENTDVNNKSGYVFSEKTVNNEITNDLPTELEEGKLVKHNLIVAIEKCDIDYDSHLNIHAKTLYSCKTCHETFSLASKLKEHTNVHKREKPYACNLCDKTYSSIFDLKDHKVHETQCYACATCYKTYPRLYDLKVHIRVHTGQRRHACRCCDKTFSLVSSLKKHMFSHKGWKPFACDLCDETFDLENLIESHKLDHAQRPDTVLLTETKAYRRYDKLNRSQNILITDVQTITEDDFKNGGDKVTMKKLKTQCETKK